MLDSIWRIIAIPLGFLLKYCYIFVNDILHLPLPYVFAVFLLALIINILLFPFSLKQQRTTAIASAYKPMIDEINQKCADNRKKRDEELAKLEKEFGYKPIAGGLQILIQFPIIFGLIEVINRPLSYMLRLPEEFVAELSSVTANLITDVTGLSATEAAEQISFTLLGRNIETKAIGQIKNNPGAFSEMINGNPLWADEIKQIADLKTSIGPIDFYTIPRFEWSWMILIPFFLVVTTILSSFISMKNSSGFHDRNSVRSGILMMALSGVMFALLSFISPSGFSLYWGISNLLVIVQSFILKKICNANTIIAEQELKIEAKKQAAIDARTVEVRSEDGTVELKELSEEDIAEIRLKRAMELDMKRYEDNIDR